MLKINDIEIEFNYFDVECMEKVNIACECVQKEIEQCKELEALESIKVQCQAVRNAFTNIFGEDIAQKVLGEKHNYLICLDAFTDLISYKLEQDKEIQRRTDKMNKINGNRTTRRAIK